MGGVSVGKIYLDLGINTSKLPGIIRGLKSPLGGLGTTIAAAFSVRAIVNFSKECINLGSDITEVQNVVDVAFGDMKHKMEAFAATSIETFGMSALTAKQTGSSYMAMAKGMGMASDAASDMALSLTGLSADMASFYNINQSEARTALSAVFTGETETLKRYGILITEVNLQEFARQKGITKSISAMTQQEKVMLRYNYVLQATNLASGDFVRTQNSWANQTRILSERFNALKATLGQAFINILTPCLQILNQLIARLQVFADALLFVTQQLFGDAGGATSTAAVASEEIASNTASAAKSAKDYAKTLAGFDKLNIIGGSSGGGSGADFEGMDFGITGAGGVTADDTLPKVVEGAIDNLSALFLTGGLVSLALGAILAFTGVNIPLGIGLMAIGALGIWSAAAIDFKVINDSVANGIDLVAGTISGALLVIGGILCFSAVNIPLGIALMAAGAIGLATVAALNWDAVTNEVSLTITAIAAAVGAAVLVMGALFTFSGAAVGLGIAMMVAGAAGLVAGVALNWNSMTDSVTATVGTIAAVVGGALLGLGAVLAFTGAGIPVGLALMAAGAVSLVAGIAPNWSGISDSTKNTIAVITGIAGAAMLALGVILLLTGAGIPLGLGLIAAGGVSLAAAIAPNWGAITSTISNVCSQIGNIFSGLWEGIKSGFKAMVNGLISLANLWIDGLNLLLIPVRGLIYGIAKAFGSSISFDEVKLPHIPKLANGGYVKANTPQLAMIGDNRHQGEIVAPEGKITEAVIAALGPFVEVLRDLGATIRTMGGGNGQPIIVKCILDGKTVYETVVKQNNSVVRQTGRSLLKV